MPVSFYYLIIILLRYLNVQVLLLKQCTVLRGLTKDKWTESHDEEIRLFLQEPSAPVLLLYVDQTTEQLCVLNGVPSLQTEQAAYFVRVQNVPVTGNNFHHALQMGTIHGSYVNALLRVMHGLYAPNFFENTTWPDSILIHDRYNIHIDFGNLTPKI